MTRGDSEDEKHDSRRRRRDRRDDSSGFSFSLPPLKLPKAAFPRDLRVKLPPPAYDWGSEVRPRNVLVAAVLVDLLDAALLFVDGPSLLAWIRPAVGTGLALAIVGLPGLAYAWEALATMWGYGWLTLFPSATALALARLLR